MAYENLKEHIDLASQKGALFSRYYPDEALREARELLERCRTMLIEWNCDDAEALALLRDLDSVLGEKK